MTIKITKSVLQKLIKEAVTEQLHNSNELDSLIESITKSMKLMEEVDPKGYKIWSNKLHNFVIDLEADSRQALRWNNLKETL